LKLNKFIITILDMKRFLQIFGISLILMILLLSGITYNTLGNKQKIGSGPVLGHGVEVISDGFSACFMLDAGNGKLVLIDAANDVNGKAILDAIQRRGRSPSDIEAIFITHAHPDHIAAIHQFPKAETFAMEAEVPIAAGQEPYGSPLSRLIGSHNPHPFKITRPLRDGETVQIGNLQIQAFDLKGHTPGSGAFLAQGVLFTGDALSITREQKIEGPVWVFSSNYPEAISSLKALQRKLFPRSSEIFLYCHLSSRHPSGRTGSLGTQ
jgi:glyoxylase-like metal-dependent hydrolase (beta-lactamase superfamily II)